MGCIHIQGQEEPVHVGKIVCVGANYTEHNKEMGRADKVESILFLKPSTALLNEGQPITIPPFTIEVHHELEVVLLIGKGGKRIPTRKARNHIAAIGVGLDLTARDMQRVAKKHGLPWAVPKGFDGSAPVSKFIHLTDDIDLDDLHTTLTVNGTVRQQGHTANMLLDVCGLISYASRFYTLEAGDLIYTGTPEGVDLIKAGDVMEFGIDGLVSATYKVEEEIAVEKC